MTCQYCNGTGIVRDGSRSNGPHCAPKVSRIVTARCESSIEIDRTILIAALNRAFTANIPEGAEVTFRVPHGGDFAGMTLDVTAEDPITVAWTTTTTTTDWSGS